MTDPRIKLIRKLKAKVDLIETRFEIMLSMFVYLQFDYYMFIKSMEELTDD